MMGIIGAVNAVANTTRRRPVHPHVTGKVAGEDPARGPRPGSSVGAEVLALLLRAVLRRISDVVVQCMVNMKAMKFVVVVKVSVAVVEGDVAAPSGAGGVRPPAVAGIAVEPLPADFQTQTGKVAKPWIVAHLQYYQESQSLWSLTKALDRAASKVNQKQYIDSVTRSLIRTNNIVLSRTLFVGGVT